MWHCKSTILQFKRKKKKDPTALWLLTSHWSKQLTELSSPLLEVENHIFCMGVMGKEWLFLNMNLMYCVELFLLDESRQDKLTQVEKWHAWLVKSLSRLFATPWTVAYQAPLSMGFSRQGYWSGLLFPSRGDLPNTGTEPGSPAL